MSKKLALGSLGAVVSAVLGSGLGASVASAGPENPSDTPHVVIAESEQLVPGDTLTDWRSFSDHLAVVTVTDQRKMKPSAAEVAAGEGLIPRIIHLRVDSIMWSRPEAPDPPTSFDANFDGWEFKGDQLTPLRLRGEPMLSVGKQYVMPIVRLAENDDSASGGWSPLGTGIIPYESGVLGLGDPLITTKADAGEVWRRYYKEPAADLSDALRHTAPYPAADDRVPVLQRAKDVYRSRVGR